MRDTLVTTSEKALRFAFLGCGDITRRLSRVLRRHFRKEVECVYASRDQERARLTNSRYKGAGYFRSYEEAMRDPGVDVLWIATPPKTHLALALKGMQLGKDVIVEKPAFMQVKDFETVRKVQSDTGQRIFVAENYIYKPLTIELKKMLKEKLIGEVLFLHVNALKRQMDNGWRTRFGAFFEGGVHWVNFICSLGLDVELAHGFRAGSNDGVERSMLAVFKFKNGAVGTVSYSWELPSSINPLRISRIFGRKGTITFESNGVFIFVKGVKTKFVIPKIRDLDGRRAMIQDFVKSLQHGTEPMLTLDLAQRDYLLLERIYKSSSSALYCES